MIVKREIALRHIKLVEQICNLFMKKQAQIKPYRIKSRVINVTTNLTECQINMKGDCGCRVCLRLSAEQIQSQQTVTLGSTVSSVFIAAPAGPGIGLTELFLLFTAVATTSLRVSSRLLPEI